jgi:hypothetical protein
MSQWADTVCPSSSLGPFTALGPKLMSNASKALVRGCKWMWIASGSHVQCIAAAEVRIK